MSHSNLRTPWPIHFIFHRVIGIDGLTICIFYGEISNFHSRVMGLYSSNCRRFLDFLSLHSWMKNLNFTNSCTINMNWNIYTIFIQLKTTFFEKAVKTINSNNSTQNKNYFWQTLMKKKLPHANVQESVAMAMGALVHTYCQYPDQCLPHDTSVVNIHTIFVKTFFPCTLEWKI
jgi:hypothetical protein